jgi:hypothetical protein
MFTTERKKNFFHRTPLFAWNSPFIYLVIEVSSLLGSQLIKSCWIRSDPIVGVTDGSDCQIPSASLFNLISIRHNTETPSFSVVGSDCRFNDRIRLDSILWTPMWFRVPESGQILSDFIVLRKILIGFPSDPMRSDYRIDGPGHEFILHFRMTTNQVFNIQVREIEYTS